ncbi:DUF927 domain-containing protein [Deinococcus peraridilitoris]|uniref:DNA/RNA helicase, superfamily II n=1 Tax=Deinococcus peraridilitoris (strain DSM 19664 / LMG 22246 / CIP 109416 / KR-200) TaxID=937777 RepID=L0A1Z7_DEIPD|nr:DUF927 domain-containing protein [Deinococcus peraridilitoris]AFZ67182.1 DNA/RNA helicase, superfamily II [Deinococcus peraridilitoris DSM 19664]
MTTIARPRSFPHLTPPHLTFLQERGISPNVIGARGYGSIHDTEVLWQIEPRFVGSQRPHGQTLVIPHYRLGQQDPFVFSVRYGDTLNGDFRHRQRPYDVHPIFDLLPLHREGLLDPSRPIVFVPSVLDADALTSREGQRVVPIALEDIARSTSTWPELDEVRWEGRPVTLAFPDPHADPPLLRALQRLARALLGRQAQVRDLSSDDETQGGARLFRGAAFTDQKVLTLHPETRQEVLLPDGFEEVNGKLCETDDNKGKVLYTGRLYVSAIGTNVATGERLYEVSFDDGGQLQVVTAPSRTFAQSGSLIRLLNARGAFVHNGNAAKLVKYLAACAAHNIHTLPKRLVSDRLGMLPNGMLVTPAGSTGGRVQYIGRYADHLTLRPDDSAYQEALRVVATWEGTSVLWWLIGQTLASPFLRRLKPRRYPATYLAGDSGTGKTTSGNFAQGVWVMPGEEPFQLQGMRTTQAGMLQTLEQLGGLPLLIDEAHTCPDSAGLERTVYSFANGQSYARGSAHGQVQGGGLLGGAILLVGEARPAFQHAGSHNRLLLLSADEHPPLGADAGRATRLGQERARVLEDAWERGAGHLGPQVARVVLEDWAAFEARVRDRRAQEDLRALQEWGHAVAAVQATLNVLFTAVLRCPPPREVTALPVFLSEQLRAHRSASNPAREAFEDLRMLILQARRHQGPGSVTLHVGRELIAWQDDAHTFVLTGTRAFKGRLGELGVQLHGKRWAEQGWIAPDAKSGASTRSVYCAMTKGQVRVLAVPNSAVVGDG